MYASSDDMEVVHSMMQFMLNQLNGIWDIYLPSRNDYKDEINRLLKISFG